MSEKITFKELIESIAEETDNSRQFTQDFIKDFVEVINDGLEEDGNVNIAGFGKFNLRLVDERQGFNPQTEEKITIPAHNKLVFKPYKNLRELVNAPYAHQEPELIYDEDDSTEEGSTDPEDSDQSDFIPTGPPTSPQSTGETEEPESEEDVPFDFDDEKQDEDDETASSENPFVPDEKDTSDEKDDEDEDIVEFKAGEEDAIDEELEKFFGETEQSEEDDAGVEETLNQTEELISETDEFLESVEDEDESEKEESAPAAPLSMHQNRSTQNQTSATPMIMIAAAFILLLAAGGVWYFGLLSEGNQQEMTSPQMVSATEASEDFAAEDNQQEQAGDNQEQDNPEPQQTADRDQNQSQDASSSTTSADAQNSNQEAIEIGEGQTLWSLAEEKYGNPRLWPWIYGTNKSLENPDLIFAGSSLSVPLPSGPDNRLNNADSVGVAKGYIATYRWYKDNNSSKAKNHLLGAKVYHDDITNIADVKIDKADLSYANQIW